MPELFLVALLDEKAQNRIPRTRRGSGAPAELTLYAQFTGLPQVLLFAMKPLFDSEHFSFIGDIDDRILVHCRACGEQATVDVQVETGRVLLRASCPGCRTNRTFAVVNPMERGHAKAERA